MNAKPRLILVVRHAEKPSDPMDPDLSPAGEIRARALATYIPQTFGPLDCIFASAISKHSARSYETVIPLSEKTGVAIDSTIADNNYAFLARELLTNPNYDDKRIVVCWHHGNIPPLLHALGAPGGTFPDPWVATVFNLVLRLDSVQAGFRVASFNEPF